jgi:hypothetical protein
LELKSRKNPKPVKIKYLLMGEFLFATLAIVQNPIASIKPAMNLLIVDTIVTIMAMKNGSNLTDGKSTLVYDGINCTANKIMGTLAISQYFSLPIRWE